MEQKQRVIFVAAIFSLLLGLLSFRLYNLHVKEAPDLSKKAVETRSVKLANSPALRGIITDRKYREISDGGWGISEENGRPFYIRYGEDPLAIHTLGTLDATGTGANGVEFRYNNYLKSPPNIGIFAEKDVKGRLLPGKGVFVYPPTSLQRKNVVLTIDRDIQKIAEDACDGELDNNVSLKNGSVVVMDISNGDILAMVSRPNFNPRKPVPDINTSNLLNKSLEFYYPGSIFKILVAAAAYEEGLINPQERFFCDGNSSVNISCWKEEGHGVQTFTEAFANSCNPAFITIGQRVYRSGLESYINKFGLDRQEIIGYKYDIKEEHINIQPGKVGLANASIGQQGIQLTPVQVASLVTTIARSGESIQPRLVKEVRYLNGPLIKAFPKGQTKKAISPATAKKTQSIMMQVTNNGTGERGWVDNGGSAGKTGSAQSGSKNKDGQDIVHAWFAGYTPLNKPRYAIVVFSVDGKYGGEVSAPLFKVIAENILKEEFNEE